MKIFNRDKKNIKKVAKSTVFKMITETGNGFYAWDGKLYKSDIVRACIRPKAKAIGKLTAKHIRNFGGKIEVNPEPYMRFLLEEPNPYMSGQVMQEKVTNQLSLNNNAFILIVRDDFGLPCNLYPVPASGVQAVYINEVLHLKFFFNNGKNATFPYSEIIHLRNDFFDNDIFGESPAEALTGLMEIITTTDQGIVKAIKNSGVIRWLLKFAGGSRPEDVKRMTKEFRDNYLSYESDTFGAAGINANTEAERIEPKDYVPNALLIDRTTQRLQSFFNVNDKIVRGDYSEDEWNGWFEEYVESDALQLSNEYTRKLFTRNARSYGNAIFFEAANLQCATLSTKLALQAMVDRGALTPNEWRATFNLSPVPDGDKPIRRLDTKPTDEGGDEE